MNEKGMNCEEQRYPEIAEVKPKLTLLCCQIYKSFKLWKNVFVFVEKTILVLLNIEFAYFTRYF